MITVTNNDHIQNILDNIPLTEQVTLFLKNGYYNQKLTLRHHHLKLIGESHDVIICFNEHALGFHKDGLLNNTFRTQTVLVLGDDITLENLTIENNAGKGEKIGQAIALTSYGNQTFVKNCVLKSTQDTVFLGPLPSDLISRYAHILSVEERMNRPLRHYFYQTTIIGDVDFIFGSSDAFFKSCTIISNGSGYIAAPSTHPKSSFGLVFHQCVFKSTGDYRIILARPWRAGGKAAFLESTFEVPIALERFDGWSKPSFHFYETPYVSNTLSEPLPETMEKSIIKITALLR